METRLLIDIATRYGTPCFVYDAAAARAEVGRIRDAFSGLRLRIHYAVKANSNLALLAELRAAGAGFDIVSGGELERVLRAGGDAAEVVFSGVGKSRAEIRQALAAGIGCLNVESAAELEIVNQVAGEIGVRAPLALRVNPDVDPVTHPYIATGLSESKFGVPLDEAVLLYRRAAALAAVEPCGIAAHIGSQIGSIEPFIESLEALLGVVDALACEGIALRHIDLGGGIGVRYRDEPVPDLNAYAAAVRERLTSRDLTLALEPGRAIVANAGVLLTRVLYTKHNGAHRFAIVDAAMNDLIRPALYQAWHPVSAVATSADGELGDWDIVGPVCESGDYLAKGRRLRLAAGDLLAVGGAGAYAAVMSSNYNTRPRAPEVLVRDGEARLVRRRETIDDLLATELTPGEG